MPGEAHDFSPEELLEKQVREAYLEQDYAQVKDILRGDDFPNAVKDAFLVTALRDGKTDLVKFVIEETHVDLTAERCIMLVFLACQQKQLDVVLYLSEKTAEMGLSRSDAYELVFTKFPAEKHAEAADELLNRAADRQDALNKMLYAAAASKALGVIPHLLDKGADVNADSATVLYMLTTSYDPEYFADRDKYVALMDKYLSKFDDRATLDTALIVNAMKIADNTQYPEIIHAFLRLGADPYAGHGEAGRTLTGAFELLKQNNNVELWADTFSAARTADLARYRHEFETLFKDDFRIADLKQPVNADGDTGLMLAAKARLLDKVMETAVREGSNLITAEDILATNNRNQSVLSLALDRDDTAALFAPAYWAKADAGILRKAEAALKDEQKQWIDLPRLSSTLEQHNLKQQAQRFKLKLS